MSNTAFYCCGTRMDDAEQAFSVCDDQYAKLFMDDIALRFYSNFSQEASCNMSMLTRHRIIDDILRAELIATPDLHIVTIGAGFDTRPFRVKGGTWIELDEPELIAYKNGKLAASGCKNSLRRVPIDFATEFLCDKLAPFATSSKVMFVIEGVLLYLSQDQIKDMLSCLKSIFPQHSLVCDLITLDTLETYGKTVSEKLARFGANFQAVDNPRAVMLDDGYCIEQTISIAQKAVDFLNIPIMSKTMLKFSLMWVSHGNAVYVFGR